MNKDENIMVIDLLKLIRLLTLNIIPIIFCVIIFSLAGYFYNFQKPEMYSGITNVYISNEISFDALNSYSMKIDEITDQNDDKERIKHDHKQKVFNDLIKISSRSKFFENNLYKHYLDEGYADIEAKDNAVRDFRSFKFSKIQNEILEQGLSFSFLTDNIETTETVIEKTIEEINKQIVSNSINNFKITIDRSLHLLRNEKDLINKSIAEYNKNAEKRHKSDILFLKEQSSIANILGIEESGYNLKITNRQFEELGIGVSVSQEFPVYLQGYKAIDKLITLMENRSLETIYAIYPEINRKITSARKDLLKLNNDIQLMEFYKEDINNILHNQYAQILDYDPRYNTFVSQNSKFKDVITFGLIGLFLSCSVIIFFKYREI